MERQEEKELLLIMGGVCSGKTTHRKENYSAGYLSIDASDIFIELSKGEYYDFPSHLEREMNNIGLNRMRKAIQNSDNIVIEIIGANQKPIEEIIEYSKRIGYKTKLIHLTCDIEEAKRRNDNREDDNISAHFCEPYHIKWLKQVVMKNFTK